MGAARIDRAPRGVLVGPGERMQLLARLVEAAGRRPDGMGAPVRVLADLADLLVEGPSEGRLLLDADHLPLEDIGLLRRILQRGAGAVEAWVLGRDAGQQSARAALALPSTRWLAWPPDADQIVALAGGEVSEGMQSPLVWPGAGQSAPAQSSTAQSPLAQSPLAQSPLAQSPLAQSPLAQSPLAQSPLAQSPLAQAQPEAPQSHPAAPKTTRGASKAPPLPVTPPPAEASGRSGAIYDLTPLLEEALAALTLRGRRAPRFHFRGGSAYPVRTDRHAVAPLLEAMLLLARSCAGPGEAVHVTTSERASAEMEVSVEFPAGPLATMPPEAVLSAEGWEQVRARLPELGTCNLPDAMRPVRARGGELLADSPVPDQICLRLRLPLAAHDAGGLPVIDALFS